LVSHTKNRLSENRVLRLFGPKREEIVGGWRGLHELHLYAIPNVIRVIKARRMRWVGHVPHMGEICIQNFGWKT